MLDTESRDRAAWQLRDAEQMTEPVAPLSQVYPDIDVLDAYAIQRTNVDERIRAGARVCGHKIGLSSPVIQQMMGVHEPDFGHLLSDMHLQQGTAFDVSSLCHPRIEVEVAFVLGAALPGADCSTADVLAATDYIAVAIELIDSRIMNWEIGITDTIADNASSGFFALGPSRIRPHELNLADLEATLFTGFGGRDVPVARGNTSDVLGNPVRGVVWLARKLATFGVVLEAGHIVLSGSCTRAVDVAKGDHYRAAIVGLGEVCLGFI
ncbi:2-keto-4-pentenoate hydratase [Mycobacterium sp. BMJ-28]